MRARFLIYVSFGIVVPESEPPAVPAASTPDERR